MYRKLKHIYHDSQLKDITIGPRKEITLEILLDKVWNNGCLLTVNIRFGEIKNFDNVSNFFDKIDKIKNRDFLCEIVDIEYDSKESILVDLVSYGSVLIETRKVSET